MNKREIIEQISFGERVAEAEADELTAYFVQTDEWRQIVSGQKDVIYGAKGSGKSAIYSRLLTDAPELQKRGILLVPAENPRGATVFQDLITEPPVSQEQFRALWKLYFLTLAGQKLVEFDVLNEHSKFVLETLKEAKLIDAGWNLKSLFRGVRDYVSAWLRAGSFEAGMKLDPYSGLPAGFTGKISFGTPGAEAAKLGFVDVQDVLDRANNAFAAAGKNIWIALDRLDVAFADHVELEKNALRALFLAYLDMEGFDRLSVLIFLRSDIWRRITESGFREASHITRTVSIRWNQHTLLNLIVKRLINNPSVCSYYGVSPQDILEDFEQQRIFFYRLFPQKVEGGERQSETFDWLLSHTCDGSDEVAPRELIHILSETRALQLANFSASLPEPPGATLFDRTCIKSALGPVSKVRLDQTLLAEHPELRESILELDGEKTEQTATSLSVIWDCSLDEATKTALRLVEVGFFRKPDRKKEERYWVPFLYRPSLKMIQGSADK
jgi:hypothetical protein